MTLTQSQIKQLKEQLKAQVSHLPQQQKSEALKQIDSMSDEAIETLLKQQSQSQENSPDGNNIFRMIINGEIDSIKISENSEAIAVLDINPISKGHLMIIPKSPVKNPKQIPKSIFSLAESLSKKISENLKAKSVRLETSQQFGEAIIHLIPIYPDSSELNIKSPRNKSTTEELQEIANQIKKEVIKISHEKEKIKLDKKGKVLEIKEETLSESSKESVKKSSKKKDKIIKLPRRIP